METMTIACVVAALVAAPQVGDTAKPERIKAFCVDFNWAESGFAPPGMYVKASPKNTLNGTRSSG
jgi:hypothetical protein